MAPLVSTMPIECSRRADMGVFSIQTPDAECTQRVGRALALELLPGDCVALIGDLGAGKTCLVRGLAEGLGCDAANVSSPTFTLMHRYPGSLCDLVHVDAYRLREAGELRDAGVDTGEIGAIIAIEWPRRVPGVLPARHVEVRITPIGETERQIDVQDDHGTLAERLAAAVGPKACPSCKQPADTFGVHWPFCGPRCRSADLGRWLTGQYQISRPIEERDLDEG